MKKKFKARTNKVIRFGDKEWQDVEQYANKRWRGNASHAVRYLVMVALQSEKDKKELTSALQ